MGENLVFFFLFKDEYETKTGRLNVTLSKLQEMKHTKNKIEQSLNNISKKENEYFEKRKILKNELNTLEKEEKKIRLENSEINKRITAAENEVRNSEAELSDGFYNCYNFLKNPMKFSNEFFNSLNNFEDKLTKMGIPKSVGDSFFSELIDSKECLCGKQLDEEIVSATIAAVLTTNAVIGFISKYSAKLFRLLNYKKGEDIAEKIHHWAHDNEKIFQAPIKRVLGFFVKDPKTLDILTKSVYAIMVGSMAAGYGAAALDKLSHAEWFQGALSSLKTVAKSEEAIVNAYPAIRKLFV